MERYRSRERVKNTFGGPCGEEKREKKRIDGRLLEGFAKDEKAKPKAKQANQE